MSSDDVKVTEAAAKRPRPRRLRDMALSIAVLLVPLGIFYWAWDWAASDRQVTVADTREDRQAAEGLGMDVVVPELDEEWKPISSALDAGEDAVTLRTGWYSPDGFGLQLVQTTGEVEALYEDLTGAGEPVEAGGLTWASHDATAGEVWVFEEGDSTVILIAEPDAIPELPELAEGVAKDL